MYCSNCKEENEDTSLFCAYCGHKLQINGYDAEYNEAIEQLRFQGYDILEGTIPNDNQNKRINMNEDVVYIKKLENNTTEKKSQVISNDMDKLKRKSTRSDLMEGTKGNNRERKMGEVIVENSHKENSIVPIIICIIVLVILICGGVFGIIYCLF
ncbi:zinc ribbon domain-containing protein [Clostridium bornimense]|uniref:zinc-ribbon domain-containing protein n=1 Tax=Clostridium bornimense TaxID=1216932 RepID=UPI001C12607C|nr:zinc ribbon domain-containing protein [Clostridium bornimense]